MKNKILLRLMAGLALTPLFFSCEEDEPVGSNTLEVVPSSAIQFLATGNEAKVLTVETDAKEWNFTAPEWIETVKGENTLTVNAKDNTGASRAGRIEFTAGTADKVAIPVLQAALSGGGDENPEGSIKASLVDGEGNNDLQVTVKKQENSYIATVKIVLEEPAKSAVNARVVLDQANYLAEYSYAHDNIDCIAFPDDKVTFPAEGVIAIAEGKTESDPVTFTFDISSMEVLKSYLVSIVVESSEGLSFSVAGKRVNWLLKKVFDKEVKNAVCLEVNNTNPLNILEYKLEDGTPFFDMVIIFAANINYDAVDDRVYLHNNPNVQALLTQTETYIQPLRKAGIEVHLGLLPNWTAASLTNLSEKGAKRFAADVAAAVKEYKLDGVFLDEEYQKDQSDSDLFNPVAPEGGMYLAYELHKQMNDACDWPCRISLFDFKWNKWDSVTRNGKTYTSGMLFDGGIFGNYGHVVRPENCGEDVTLKQCSGKSIECNLGLSSCSEEQARTLKAEGFGWTFWFAFHPQIGGGLSNNAPRIDPQIKATARGLYGMELMEPTHYYQKLAGQGIYDPNPIPRDASFKE